MSTSENTSASRKLVLLLELPADADSALAGHSFEHSASGILSRLPRGAYSELLVVLYGKDYSCVAETLDWKSMQKMLISLYLGLFDAEAPLAPVSILFAGFSSLRILEPAAAGGEPDALLFYTARWRDSALSVARHDAQAMQSPLQRLLGVTATGSKWGSFSDVCVGGTFDHLHAGHKVLLSVSALLASDRLLCGVADAELLKNKKYHEFVEPYDLRAANVLEFLQLVRPSVKYECVPIRDVYGPAASDAKLNAIVVSKETESGGSAINQKRSENTLQPLAVQVIDLVMSDHDTSPANMADKLSSTYLRSWVAQHAR